MDYKPATTEISPCDRGWSDTVVPECSIEPNSEDYLIEPDENHSNPRV
ncbi:hypothetical protein [Coleofasciculus sp.]